MVKAHPLEFRKRAPAQAHSCMSQAKAAAELKTSKTFVQIVLARHKLTGSVLPSEKRGHRGRNLTPEHQGGRVASPPWNRT